jgi:hypothetical protein
MAGFKAAAIGAALLTMFVAPLAAQQPSGAPPTATAVPDHMVAKTGAALRDVTEIRQSYAPRVAAATSEGEKQGLQQQAMDAAVKAIGDRGLSLDQYNDVIRAAQGDPQLEQRLVAAAKTAK